MAFLKGLFERPMVYLKEYVRRLRNTALSIGEKFVCSIMVGSI